MGGDSISSQDVVNKHVLDLTKKANRLALFSIIGVVLMVVQNEIAWHWNVKGNSWFPLCGKEFDPTCDPSDKVKDMFPIKKGKTELNVIRALISVTVVFSIYYLHQYYCILTSLWKHRNLLPASVTLFGSVLKWDFLKEMIVLAIHVFPGIDEVSPGPNLILFCSVTMFCRLYLLARVLRYRSPLNTPNGRFIGALTSVDFDSSFILKTQLKNDPVVTMLSCFMLLMLCAGYSLHLIESIMCGVTERYQCSPLSFWDAEWLLLITILTVGYGDIVPYSDGGRFIALVGGLGGTLITAITIALTTSYLDLSRSESKVVAFLKRDSNKKKKQAQAAALMSATYRYYCSKKKAGESAKKAHEARRCEIKMFDEVRKFREVKRYVQSNDGTDLTDRQLTLLETMEVNVDDIGAKLEHLEKHVLPPEDDEDEDDGMLKPSLGDTADMDGAMIPDADADAAPAVALASAAPPKWVMEFSQSMEAITKQLAMLSTNVNGLQKNLEQHVTETNRRLTKLEGTTK